MVGKIKHPRAVYINMKTPWVRDWEGRHRKDRDGKSGHRRHKMEGGHRTKGPGIERMDTEGRIVLSFSSFSFSFCLCTWMSEDK